jgi:hypothetical protein
MDTTRTTTDAHRKTGRGRRAFWVAIALGVLIAIAWLAPTRAHQAQGRGWASHDRGAGTHSLATLGIELREHSGLLEQAGLSAQQVAQLGDIIDQRSAVFTDLESTRTVIEQRVANAIAAENLDVTELAAVLGDARGLADRALDESFDLIAAVAGELTPAQRADLLRDWLDR